MLVGVLVSAGPLPTYADVLITVTPLSTPADVLTSHVLLLLKPLLLIVRPVMYLFC